jgi:MFS transporter, DHA2 family, multidrug resistance protein
MGKVDSRILISLGYLTAAISLWMMTQWSLEMGTREIILSGFVQGIGLGLVFVPVNLLAFSTLAPSYRTDGTTMMTLSRNLGSSFGISVIVTILARNIQISHADIAANVTSFNVPAVDPATTAAILGGAGAGALAILDGEVNRQAAMIAYLDNFYVLFWLMLCFVPLSWMLKRPGQAR